ncbi:MAG: hypothetical protein R3F39_09175 [Myxococcota bacterium]
MNATWTTLAACLLLLLSACDDGGGSASDAAGDTGAASGTTYVDWTPGATTTKKPAFDSSCRLRAADHRELASTGATDDRLSVLGLEADGARLEVAVVHSGSSVLIGTVLLSAVRPGQSWGAAKGTASWTGDAPFSGLVVDGTLCFQAPLAVGQGVKGEFSFVVDVEGQYVSVGGDFALAPDEVQNLAPLTVRADPVELDLR